MDTFTVLFWAFTVTFISSSAYLLPSNKNPLLYTQIASGLGIFAMSKIGRTFLGLE